MVSCFAAATARARGPIGRSALQADTAAMLAPGPRRRTRCAQTTAASMSTMRAARAGPAAALLAALNGSRARAGAAAAVSEGAGSPQERGAAVV